MKRKIKKRIFEVLKQIREDIKCENCPFGVLVVFSDLANVFGRGAIPIGVKPTEFEDTFNVAGNIFDENAFKIIRKVGDDGAVLVDDGGNILAPAVYLNVNLFSVDKEEIDAEFCARHIAALATSSATKANVYTLSEETAKVREFIRGKLRKQHPEPDSEKLLEKVQEDIQKEQIKENLKKKIKEKAIEVEVQQK